MTINDVITYVDSIKSNIYPESTKIKWLSELDANIKHDIINTHDGGDGKEINPYTSNTETLLVPFPDDSLYADFLCMKIDQMNGEISKYNNSALVFNNSLDSFAKKYNREHLHL